MYDLKNKQVVVIGLGSRGRAACELLQRRGAKVSAVDSSDNAELRQVAVRLRQHGVEVELGATGLPGRDFEMVVTSPAVSEHSPLVQEAARRNVPIIGELELGYRLSHCLNIAIAGTNGKSTAAEMIERVLVHNHRKTRLCGHRSEPLCGVVEQSKDLDYLILQVNSFQLERTQYFRPAAAVLLNLAADHLDRYASAADYARATARLFANQQPFDWAVVQSAAREHLHALNIPLPAKVITFSASDPQADIYLERGLILSRLTGWEGPLLDIDQCRVRGPHNAENLMAALAVGHVLRLSLDSMVETLKDYSPSPHRCELVAEWNGVKFVNDAKSTNVDALHKALLTFAAGPGGAPNLWLIAGGRDKGLDFHAVGPLLTQRVKGAFLIGEAQEKIRAAWSLFTPCTATGTLLEAIHTATEKAVPGDVVLLSPACSSFDQFRNYQHRGEVFRQAVRRGEPDDAIVDLSENNQTEHVVP